MSDSNGTRDLPRILGEGRALCAALVVLAGIAQAVSAGAAAFATRDLFAALHAGAAAPSAALALLLGGGLGVAVARLAERSAAEWLGHGYAISLRRALYRHLARTTASSIDARRRGAIGLRFVGDLTAARDWVGLGMTRLLSASVVVPGAALALWLLEPRLAAFAIVPLGIALAASVAAALLMEPLHRRLRSRRAGLATTMMERAAVAPALDLMGRTSRELDALEARGLSLRRRATARRALGVTLQGLPAAGAAVGGATLLWAAAGQGAAAANVAGMLAVLGILALPLQEIGGVHDRRGAWRVARAKLWMLLDGTRRSQGPRARPSGAASVEFVAVRHNSYRFDLKATQGAKLLVTGAHGSGKSTLLALAAGLETPRAGTVSWDGAPRPPARTVLVSADSPILQGSLRRALTLGVGPRPDDDTITSVARRFGLASLIERPDGLDMRVCEDGRTLSSGERLRLRLARAALARHAPLLLIDLPPLDDPELVDTLAETIDASRATVLIAAGDRRLVPVVSRCLRLVDGTLCAATACEDGASICTGPAFDPPQAVA